MSGYMMMVKVNNSDAKNEMAKTEIKELPDGESNPELHGENVGC